MFYHREKELNAIRSVISQKGDKAKGILIWGVRRCGKSTLVKEALKDYEGVFINMECAEVSYEKNMEIFASIAAEETGLDYLKYVTDFSKLVTMLSKTGKDTVILLDEYQALKKSYTDGNFDSILQLALDSLPSSITIILCGSYISMMKSLSSYSSPLYGRFSLSLEIESFNYLEASAFYPSLPVHEKIAFYSVFGGLPFVLSYLSAEKGLEWNIKKLLLEKSSPVYIVLKETLLKEIFKIEKAEEILYTLGNGKKKNSEIASSLNTTSSAVAEECKRLMEMSIIEKRTPVNQKDDRKKTFYSIKDNLVRFFYTFVLPEMYSINKYGADFVWEKIKEGVFTFISYRFEDIVSSFVSLSVRNNPTLDFLDIGTYWFDSRNKNREYDVVIKQKLGYFIISCKYLNEPMKKKMEDDEIKKMEDGNIPLTGMGFASPNGYEEESGNLLHITGDDLYSEEEIKNAEKLRKALTIR